MTGQLPPDWATPAERDAEAVTWTELRLDRNYAEGRRYGYFTGNVDGYRDTRAAARAAGFEVGLKRDWMYPVPTWGCDKYRCEKAGPFADWKYQLGFDDGYDLGYEEGNRQAGWNVETQQWAGQ